MDIFKIFKSKPKSTDNHFSENIHKSVALLKKSHQYRNTEECIEAISQMCGNPSLAWELYCLIPVVMVRKIIHTPTYIDEGTLIHSDGTKSTFTVTETSLYKAIEQEFLKIINSLENEELEQILFLSAEFDAINQAIFNGSKVEDLLVSGTCFIAPETYVKTGFEKA